MATVPHIAERLRAEVLEHCGSHSPATYERIRDLKYSTFSYLQLNDQHQYVLIATLMTVRAVINETLRLFPPVPLNVRESRASPCLLPPSDPTYPEENASMPFYMPGSTTIIYLPLIVQRNKALWGPDADQFDPERWLEPERIAKFVANPSTFAPFSAGPRIVRFFRHLDR